MFQIMVTFGTELDRDGETTECRGALRSGVGVHDRVLDANRKDREKIGLDVCL